MTLVVCSWRRTLCSTLAPNTSNCYHFVLEGVQSCEVELRYVRSDRQLADIFTKALRLDMLQHFSEMLGLQHLDVPHLRARTSGRSYENNKSSDEEQEEAKQKWGDESKITIKITCGSSREPNTENAGLMESLSVHSTRERQRE